MNATLAYRAVLDLTHRMFEAATAQDWTSLIALETQRAEMVGKLPSARLMAPGAESQAIAMLITDIERESAEIVERVQHWREDVKVLLRIPS